MNVTVGQSLVEFAEYEVIVPDRRGDARGVRIAHISDLHFRRWDAVSQEAQSRLLELDYDVLCATGDFGNFRRHWQSAVEYTRRFFEPLVVKGEVFAVLGNHDDPRIAAAADMPLTFLRNESKLVHAAGGAIRLGGVDQHVRKAERLDAALAETDGDEPVVLLAHYPSTVFRLPPRRVNLVLSGHTHGGQIRLPKLGCIWPNDRIPRRMAQGLHTVHGMPIHISAGIGTSLPIRVRINCPPQITMLTLVATPENRGPLRPKKPLETPLTV